MPFLLISSGLFCAPERYQPASVLPFNSTHPWRIHWQLLMLPLISIEGGSGVLIEYSHSWSKRVCAKKIYIYICTILAWHISYQWKERLFYFPLGRWPILSRRCTLNILHACGLHAVYHMLCPAACHASILRWLKDLQETGHQSWEDYHLRLNSMTRVCASRIICLTFLFQSQQWCFKHKAQGPNSAPVSLHVAHESKQIGWVQVHCN